MPRSSATSPRATRSRTCSATHEVMKFRDDPLYVERDPAYKNDEAGSGPAFMAQVRARVADLSSIPLRP